MPDQDAEVVRATWDAWERGDLDAVLQIWDPEVVWDMSHFPGWPDQVHRGHDSVRRFLEDWLEIWSDYVKPGLTE